MGLLQSAYLNKSILLMAEKNYLQALQVSRLSLQLNQGNTTISHLCPKSDHIVSHTCMSNFKAMVVS